VLGAALEFTLDSVSNVVAVVLVRAAAGDDEDDGPPRSVDVNASGGCRIARKIVPW
jgi:hypothetical protein